jgi:cell division protein FtsI (penicillin-binding protein 3)
VKTQIISQAVYWKGNDQAVDRVPDVQGMTLRDALYVLENAGLRVAASGRGRVNKQSINPGVKFSHGATIKIELS